MCTVTWLRARGGYAVCFNRDERRTRGIGQPPEVEQRGDVAVVLPRDPDAGGTWIGANSHGLTLALLNEYQEPLRPPVESRGTLVDGLLDAGAVEDVERRLRGLELVRFAPFRLLAFGPDGRVRSARWRAERLAVDDLREDDLPVTSSSRDPGGARQHRRALFASLPDRATLAGLERFHASHEPERGALSPCMHRDDASTVSFTRVVVDGDAVELAYRPGPPCEGAASVSRSVARAAAARPAR